MRPSLHYYLPLGMVKSGKAQLYGKFLLMSKMAKYIFSNYYYEVYPPFYKFQLIAEKGG